MAILEFLLDRFEIIKNIISFFKKEPSLVGSGGNGGNATVFGKNSIAAGGNGGQSGVGSGGDGGHARVFGDNAYARGGDGGNSGQVDGRGGRRTQSPAEAMNGPTALWKYGYGSPGENSPEYNR